MTNIAIRLLKDGEESLANDFFNAIYKTRRPLENFRWEFMDAPAGKAIYAIAVAEEKEGEKIVGIQCVIPVELIHSSGRRVLTGKSEDTLVDPSYRGQKIFERMYELLFEECRKAGIRYIWGFTPAEKAFVRLGFAIPFKHQQALAVFDAAKAYEHLSKLNPKNTNTQKLKIAALCAASRAKAAVWSLGSASGYAIEKTTLEEMNTHFTKFYGESGLYNLNFSPEFIQWRFVRNPFGNEYQYYSVLQNGEAVAGVLLNVRKDVSYLEQVLVKDAKHFGAAIRLAVGKLRERNAALVRVMAFRHNDATASQLRLFGANGFMTLERGSHFVWKEIDGTEAIRPEELFLNRAFTQGNV